MIIPGKVHFPTNNVVEWSTILHLIQDVSDSNLGLETGYSGVFRGLSQFLQATGGIIP
jgi:hypothetical protein